MIDADDFIEPAKGAGLSFWTGVPCSFLTPLLNRVLAGDTTRHVGAASEGEAVALAAGAWLAGQGTVVTCQNSGLGNTVNPLTSLNWPFRIPTLLVVTWRAGPGVRDEPQHELMGEITPRLLELLRIPWRHFPSRTEDAGPVLEEATREMERTSRPFALVLEKGVVEREPLRAEPHRPGPRGTARDLREGAPPPARFAALERSLATLPESAAVIATTGKCGRELFTLCDRPQHLYQVGSMGCASALGLGVALHAERPVVVLDGDGAALLKLGALATIGAQRPGNLVHVLLDNAAHDSTGGQPTVSPGVDFAAVAVACGYPRAVSCDTLDGLETALRDALRGGGPTLIRLRIAPGSIEHLGRPTVAPHEVAQRFREFLRTAPAERAEAPGSG